MPNNFKFFTFYFFLFLNNHLYPQSILINDFQVNENISWTSHYDPQITMLADGSSIIVWYDYKNTNADIFLQRFDKNLNRVGEEVLVNNNAGSSSQEKPDIDVNRNGGFVTVWMDSRAGNDEIYTQIFDSLAHPIGENFSVNEGADDLSEYSYPSVAVSNDGSFVVVWQGRRNNEYGIFTKVFNKNGQSVTDVFRVNDSSSSSDQYVRPDIGMDDNDNFVVVWEDVLPNIHRYIFAQRFNILGRNSKIWC